VRTRIGATGTGSPALIARNDMTDTLNDIAGVGSAGGAVCARGEM
jgi:hypothetical protein